MILSNLVFHLIYFAFTFNLSFGTTPIPNFKKAYSEHYQGSLLFAEGETKRAREKFKNAHAILPDNFHFSLALGLANGKLGNQSAGVEMVNHALSVLDSRDPDYQYKRCIATFLRGMVYAYNEAYGAAHQNVSNALSSAPDTANLKSVLYNTLGYLSIMNQSLNQHRYSKLPAHIHIRKNDLIKAREYFEAALEADDENGVAFKNYKMLSDTLGLLNKYAEPQKKATSYKAGEFTFLYMHQKIIKHLNLNKYAELAFLVDVSGSMVSHKVICMGDTRFAVMKDLSRKIVDDLPDQTALGLGTIGGDCPDKPAKWQSTGSLNKTDMNSELRFLIPDGTTPLLTRLLKAPELFSDTSNLKNKSLFLISDGSNTCREAGFDLCAFANTLARKGITVNVLTFLNSTYNNTSAFSEYICLADNTGGRVIYLDNYRCNFEPFNFDLTSTCLLTLPVLDKSECWGPGIKNLWMYAPPK